MDVQKGIVKYKDRTDIVCEYGIVGDKQYYFMPGERLNNGNIIATTALVEAVDLEVQPANIGLINPEGVELIPFENKSIKPINDDYLLVEKARPTSVSVISALSSRSDPLAATKLVTTAATKKESVTAVMGVDGKFIFNDQFSEASVFTTSGVNVLNGEYYSFIGINDSNIYYSTNVVEDQVYQLPLTNNLVENNNVEVNEAIDSFNSNLDVTSVGASQEEIANSVDQAMESVISDTEGGETVEALVTDESSDVIVPDVPAVEEDTTKEKTEDSIETTDSNEKEEVVEDEISEEVSDTDNLEADEEVVNEEDNTSTDNQDITSEISEENDEVIKEDNEITSPVEEAEEDEIIDNSSIEEELSGNKSGLNIDEDDTYDVSDEFKLDTDNYREQRHERVIPMKRSYFENDDYSRDSYNTEDSYYNDSSVRDFDGDTIIKDVATTMTELIRQNKDQRSKINSLENRNEVLDNKVISLENVVSKLENQKQTLENRNEQMEEKIHTQSNIIDRQRDEIDSLKEQLEGKKDLVRLLNDAQSVLRNDTNSYDYDTKGEYSYRRVA